MNIFELFGTIAIKNDDANKSIDETNKKASNLSRTMRTAFNKIGKVATTCGQVVAGGLAVGTAVMGSIVKSAIGEYAEYEQLVGGVETLFKDSSEQVLKYADDAYKNQGLSANEYLEMVTSFSATLLKGLNGDTAAAAKMADIAITDMSDNANTFGTDVRQIQQAYQGFAKQNYTMLDNLKLGYGGTQEEMARLINDSGVLGDTMTVTVEDVKNLPFDVIIAAIHEVQTEMGITGKTAKEASSTISGSWNSLKGAWSNLLAGLAKEGDITTQVDAVLETGKTWLSNVEKVLPVIKDNFTEAFNYIGKKVKTAWTKDVWPAIQQYTKAEFGIDLPEWSEIETTVSNWWNALKTNVQNTCTWLLKFSGISAWTEEDTKAIRDWWSGEGGVLSKIDEAIEWILNPELPDPEETVQKITEWWEGVKSKLKLTFAVQMYAEYTEKVQDAAGSAGAAVTEATGNANLGEQVESYIYNTSTWNPDSNVNLGWLNDLFHGSNANDTDDEQGGSSGKPDSAPSNDGNGSQWQWSTEGLQEIEGIFGKPSSELQTTIQNWTNTFDMDAFASKMADAVVAGMGNVTITTGNVMLNDGALVGRILPKINLGMGQLMMQNARG